MSIDISYRETQLCSSSLHLPHPLRIKYHPHYHGHLGQIDHPIVTSIHPDTHNQHNHVADLVKIVTATTVVIFRDHTISVDHSNIFI